MWFTIPCARLYCRATKWQLLISLLGATICVEISDEIHVSQLKTDSIEWKLTRIFSMLPDQHNYTKIIKFKCKPIFTNVEQCNHIYVICQFFSTFVKYFFSLIFCIVECSYRAKVNRETVLGVLHPNFKWFAKTPLLIGDKARVFWG